MNIFRCVAVGWLAFLASVSAWGNESTNNSCSAPTPPSLADRGFSCEELWKRQIGLESTAKYSELARQSSDRFRQSVQAGEALIDQAILGAKMLSVASVGANQGVGEEFVLELTQAVADLAINSMPIDGLDDATRREALSFLNTAIAESIKTGMSANDPNFPIIAAADLSNKIVALWNANREIAYRNRDIVAYAVLTEYFLGDQSMEAAKRKFKLLPGASDEALYDAIAEAYGLKGAIDKEKVASIIKSVMRLVDLETKSRLGLESQAEDALPSGISAALSRRPIVEKGSISVETAMRILTSEKPEYWSTRLNEIHRKLSTPLAPSDVKRLAGNTGTDGHVSNLRRLRRCFPDDLSLSEALLLLDGISEAKYKEAATLVMYHMRVPFDPEAVIAIAGPPDADSYNYLFSSALDALPKRISDEEAILLLNHSPKNRRVEIARKLRRYLVPPVSPAEIRRMSGNPNAEDYSYFDVFRELRGTMAKSISSNELFLLLEGTAPEDRRAMEKLLIPLLNE